MGEGVFCCLGEYGAGRMTSAIMVSPTRRSGEKKQNNEAETSVMERTCACVRVLQV